MDIENAQQTEATETPAESGGDPTRDDLIAVAREAIAATGGEPATPAAYAPAAATETAAAADDPEAKIAAIMAKRAESHTKKLDADDYFAQRKAEADTLKQQVIDEARAEAKRQAEAELEGHRAKFRANPVAFAAALTNGNVDEFIQQVLRHETPEAAAHAKREAELETLRAEAREGKTAKETVDQFLKQQEQERRQAVIEQVKTQFLSEHASVEKAPYMHARWEPEEVFQRCNALAVEWQKDGLKLGIDFDRDTVAAYLEKQSREHVTSKLPGLTPAQQSGAGAPAREPGIAPKSAANGMRTIPVASTSERRASPKPFNELSPAEQREDLMRVAREAMRQTGKT